MNPTSRKEGKKERRNVKKERKKKKRKVKNERKKVMFSITATRWS